MDFNSILLKLDTQNYFVRITDALGKLVIIMTKEYGGKHYGNIITANICDIMKISITKMILDNYIFIEKAINKNRLK